MPADWPVDKDLVWTLTVNGTTLKAFGSLWPVWEIDELDDVGEQRRPDGENVRRAGESAADDSCAAAGSVDCGVGQPLTLVLPVKDDGLPTPEIRARGTGGPRIGRGAPPPECASSGSIGGSCARTVPREMDSVPGSREGEDRSGGIGGARRRRQADAHRGQIDRRR